MAGKFNANMVFSPHNNTMDGVQTIALYYLTC